MRVGLPTPPAGRQYGCVTVRNEGSSVHQIIGAAIVATRRLALLLGLSFVLAVRLAYVFAIPDEISRWRDGLSYDDVATGAGLPGFLAGI